MKLPEFGPSLLILKRDLSDLDLTSPVLSDIIPSMYGEEKEKYPPRRCKESPRFGERGGAPGGEYTLEPAPKQPVGLSRRAPGAPVTARECEYTP